MARIFLDTNILIDLIQDRGNQHIAQELDQHTAYISPLSTHILFYSQKIKVPNPSAIGTISQFEVVDLSKAILDKSLVGPTPDLEDNIQLHSAAESDCDLFLTHDANLLKISFFGKTKIVSNI